MERPEIGRANALVRRGPEPIHSYRRNIQLNRSSIPNTAPGHCYSTNQKLK